MSQIAETDLIAEPIVSESSIIPRFPDFKKLDFSCKRAIQAYATQHKPYSTFNSTNLWAWDIRDDRMVSELNGNLVVLFSDYKTGEPFLSFHGKNQCEDTIRTLLEYSKGNCISPILRFVTEDSLTNLNIPDLFIQEDKDNFDYIFSTAHIAKPQGSAYKQKRHQMQRFMREYPDALFVLKDITDVSVQKQIISVLRKWENKKILENKLSSLEFEEVAINRIFNNASEHNLLLSCAYHDDVMIGFSIDEVIHDKYAMAHFIKADTSFRGVYEFLNEKIAQYLIAHDVTLWNWQQDLGIPGLRKLKMSYRPVSFLKKFKVSTEKFQEKIPATEKHGVE